MSADPSNPEIRASDGDRDRVAAALREHCAQGRITVEELNERIDRAYAARTLGDLARVTADLPEEDMYELPVPATRRSTPAHRPYGAGTLHPRAWGMRPVWATWATVNLLCVMIWLIVGVSGGSWYPWWIWVAGPWGALLLAGQIFGSSRDRR